MTEEFKKKLITLIETNQPFLILFPEKTNELVNYHFHSNQISGPEMAYMIALAQTYLHQGILNGAPKND